MSQRIWRLSKARHAASAMSGDGARRVGGRWNPPGHSVVYASSSLALACLESIVHFDAGAYDIARVCVPIDLPGDLPIERLDIDSLPDDWRASPLPESTQALGRQWLQQGRSAVLAVPSAIVPQEHNYLLSPAHPDFPRIEVGPARPYVFDPRIRPT